MEIQLKTNKKYK